MVGIVTLLVAFSYKYTLPIRKLLAPLGFPYRSIMRILLLCRSQPKYNIRLFIESAIVKAAGNHKSKEQWKSIINDFDSLLKKQQDNNVSELQNCMLFINKNSHKSLVYIFCEIENPNMLVPGSDLNYLHFWNKLAFRRIEFSYVQPALDTNKEPADSLHLAAYSFLSSSGNSFSIDKDIVLSVLHDYAIYARGIEYPMGNPTIQQMATELANMPQKIHTLKLI